MRETTKWCDRDSNVTVNDICMWSYNRTSSRQFNVQVVIGDETAPVYEMNKAEFIEYLYNRDISTTDNKIKLMNTLYDIVVDPYLNTGLYPDDSAYDKVSGFHHDRQVMSDYPYYHSLTRHIQTMFKDLERLIHFSFVPEFGISTIDVIAMTYAIFWHDAGYFDTYGIHGKPIIEEGAKEDHAIDLFLKYEKDLPEDLKEKVANIIACTKIACTEFDTLEEKVMRDLDWLSFSSLERLQMDDLCLRYESLIRGVEDSDVYKAMRNKFLKTLLERPIFYSPVYKQLNDTAHNNIKIMIGDDDDTKTS